MYVNNINEKSMSILTSFEWFVHAQVGGFDLIWDNGPIESRERERPTDMTTLLGTHCDSQNYEAAPMKRPTGNAAKKGET